MPAFLDKYLEYILVVLLAGLAAAGVAAYAADHSGSSSGTAGVRDCQGSAAAPVAPGGGEGTCRSSGTVYTIVRSRHPLRLPGVTVRVQRAAAFAAATPAGRGRGRSRVAVKLDIANTGTSPLPVSALRPTLQLDTNAVPPDPAAAKLPGGLPLNASIKPGTDLQGIVRFELVKPATDQLSTTHRAVVRLSTGAGKAGLISVRVNPTQPAGPGA
jgi:hypothetical protein